MTTINTRKLQQMLTTFGFEPGPIDGIYGRRTIAAVRDFQTYAGIAVDGIVGPQTIAALNARAVNGGGSLNQPPLVGTIEPPWYALAKRKVGLQENRDRISLMAWLRSDKHTLGDPSKLPWCGDFVETCIALTLPNEPMVTNPYYALNWRDFGRSLGSHGARGAVLVFIRPGGGHVGFYAGEDATAYHVLGGNQSNSVSICRVAKTRLAAIRWPSTYHVEPGLPVKLAAGTKPSVNEA